MLIVFQGFISNYASAIKSYVTLYKLPSEWLSKTKISNYFRALHIQIPYVRKQKGVLSLQDLYNISVTLEKFDNAPVYRCGFLLSFYGFLRISNLVAPTTNLFDVERQLCHRDVSMSDDTVMLYLMGKKSTKM